MAGWYRKGSVPRREEGRAQRKERREKRETSTTKISSGEAQDGEAQGRVD